MKRALLMAAVLVGFAPAAMADNYVWFEAVASGPFASNAVVNNQGLGQKLELATLGPGPASWTVSMRLDQGEVFTGWAEDLQGTPDPGEMSAANVTYGNWPATSMMNPGQPGPFPWLTYGSFGSSLPPWTPPGLYTLFSFELTWTPSGPGEVAGIDNWIGTAGWGNLDPGTLYAPYVYFADITPATWTLIGLRGDPLNAGEVIKLVAAPEPTTLALFALGALALIRKRQSGRARGGRCGRRPIT